MASTASHKLDEEIAIGEKVFPFFRLARELRNEIYSHLTTQIDGKCHARHDRHKVSADVFPLPTLRTINKQFKSEDEEEILSRTEVVLSTYVSESKIVDVLVSSRCNPFLGQIRHVMLKLFPAQGPLSNEIFDMEDIDRVAQVALSGLLDALANLRTISLIAEVVLRDLERCCTNHRAYAPVKFFEDHTLATSSSRPSMVIQKALILSNYLYSVNDQAIEDDDLSAALEWADGNHIKYLAIPSEKGSGWYGLNLLTVSAGGFDYWATAKALEAERAENEIDDYDLGGDSSGYDSYEDDYGSARDRDPYRGRYTDDIYQ